MVSLFSIKKAQAQVRLNINIGAQPAWGPTGYDHVDYYYLPDIDSYYYVPTGQYIYSNGGRWISSSSLPSQFRNFDLYRAYKAVVNEPKPYLRNNVYAAKYRNFKNYNGRQTVIRDSRDTKYNVVKGHPSYIVNKSIIVNKNRPARSEKTVLRLDRNESSARVNGDRYHDKSSRLERNDGERGANRH
ncbi:hypothetical protein ASG14_19290 [Pedobacter sp. Leaf194]|nr:hypothetical protein ASG14_19290 [Pedobacter sp. Leaf194]